MHLKNLLTHTISQNAFANIVRTVLQIAIGFGGNYYIVRAISPEKLGIWALVFTFASFLNLADFGVSTALIRFIANDEKKRHEYFWTTVGFYTVVGLIGSVLLLTLQWLFAPYFFKDTSPDILFTLAVLAGAYLALLASTITNVFNGLQMMKSSGSIEVLKSFVFYVTILVLLPRLDLFAFSTGLIVSNLLAIVLGYTLLIFKIPLPFSWPDWKVFKQLFVFGGKSYGIQIVNQIKGAYLKILTSRLFMIEYVAFVDLAQRVCGYFRQFLLSAILPLLPAASSYHAKKETQKITKLYQLSLLALVGFGGLSTLVFYVLSPYVISLWLGPEYSPVIRASQLLSFAVFLNLLAGPGFSILQGIGKQKPLLITAVFGLVSFLLLTTLFALPYGFNGIFVGNIAGELVATFVFLFWIWKKKPMVSIVDKHVSTATV
jgi:O-antigen/teichoic acid export membrane protein